MFDYTVIASRLMTVIWSKYSPTTGMVNRFTDPNFLYPVRGVQSKL